MASAGAGRLALVLTGALFLTACEDGGMPFLEKKDTADGETATPEPGGEATLLERDVEAPDVFKVKDAGLWDGRPSLGGIWVAHPDVTDPERVMVRNQVNGKSVIGALFRRERDNPGPRFQVSSDAAAALGMLAGAPAELDVTAMRREEVPIATPAAAPPAAEAVAEGEAGAEPVATVAAAAASAIDKAEAQQPAAGTAALAKPAPQPKMQASAIVVADPAAAPAAAATAAVTTAPLKSSLSKPYLQIGIFSVEANAGEAAEMLRKSGIVPVVRKSTSDGKEYWRVLAGPVASAKDQAAIQAKVKALGFPDAYAVKN